MHTLEENERIIRIEEVMNRTGLSRSTIYAYIEKGKFPKRIKIGLRAVGWYESEISKWVASHKEKSEVYYG